MRVKNKSKKVKIAKTWFNYENKKEELKSECRRLMEILVPRNNLTVKEWEFEVAKEFKITCYCVHQWLMNPNTKTFKVLLQHPKIIEGERNSIIAERKADELKRKKQDAVSIPLFSPRFFEPTVPFKADGQSDYPSPLIRAMSGEKI